MTPRRVPTRPIGQLRRGPVRRGTVLIVTMVVVAMLAGMVLVLGRSTRVEAMASGNLAASLQASAVARGAEQYLVALLATDKDNVWALDEQEFAGVQVGDGYFWVVRPDYGEEDDSLPVFGFTDENGKLNVNAADLDALLRLPGMDESLAAAIIDWRDADSTPGNFGAEDEAYPDYYVKNAPFETVEELLLVSDVTRELLYGDGQATAAANPAASLADPGQRRPNFSDVSVVNGLFNYLTVYSKAETAAAATTGSTGGTTGGSTGGGQTGTATQAPVNINDTRQRTALRTLLTTATGSEQRANQVISAIGNQQFIDVFDFYFRAQLTAEEFDEMADQLTTQGTTTGGGGGGGGGGGTAAAPAVPKINVNTAPRVVLMTLPNLEAADVDNAVAERARNPIGTRGIAWFADALGREKAVGLGNRVTGKTSYVSADIVAVSGNGRAFKRVRIVIDAAGTAAGTAPQIIYRRDITAQGWPLDPAVLEGLRAGQGIDPMAGVGGGFGQGGRRMGGGLGNTLSGGLSR